MTRLTDPQLVVLSSAAARDDRAAALPRKMPTAAALKVGASLLARKLMREVRARAGIPVWREDEEGRGLALVITKAGLAAINADEAGGVAEARQRGRAAKGAKASAKRAVRSRGSTTGSAARPSKHSRATTQPKHDAPTVKTAAGQSKQAIVVGMLSAKDGATLDALIAATGWLPHTTRAVLTGLRKKGFALERARQDGVTTYRITAHPAEPAAA
ncbi:MAG: DUF3489 domain-containing protein [Beijerinckiaceae bacterium]